MSRKSGRSGNLGATQASWAPRSSRLSIKHINVCVSTLHLALWGLNAEQGKQKDKHSRNCCLLS
jgi:hypothetical protein